MLIRDIVIGAGFIAAFAVFVITYAQSQRPTDVVLICSTNNNEQEARLVKGFAPEQGGFSVTNKHGKKQYYLMDAFTSCVTVDPQDYAQKN